MIDKQDNKLLSDPIPEQYSRTKNVRKFYISDSDGYSQTAEIDENSVTLVNEDGFITKLLIDGDNFLFKTTDLQDKTKTTKIPNDIAYDLPLLMILLNKSHGNLFPVTTITELTNQFKLFD